MFVHINYQKARTIFKKYIKKLVLKGRINTVKESEFQTHCAQCNGAEYKP